MLQTITLPPNNMNPNDGLHADFHTQKGDDPEFQYHESEDSNEYYVEKADRKNNVFQEGGKYRGSTLPNGNERNKNTENYSYLRTPAQSAYDTSTLTDSTFSSINGLGKDFSRRLSATPRDFATVGETPLTGASLGSSDWGPTPPGATPGILKTSNYAAPASLYSTTKPDGIQVPTGITGMGLLRGNNPLGPTPLLRRKDVPERRKQIPTPSPGQHYHATITQDETITTVAAHKKRVGFPPVEEEDPAMLRYQSRPGSDHSPLVARGMNPTGGEIKREVDAIEATRTPPAQNNKSEPAYSALPSLSEFPFYYDGYTSWICRHCCHIPPIYRGPNHIWQFPHAPPNDFVDHHLRYCPGLRAVYESPESQQQHLRAFMDYSHNPSMPSLSQGNAGTVCHPYPIQQQYLPFNQNQPQHLNWHDLRQTYQQTQDHAVNQPVMHPGGAPDPPGVTSSQRFIKQESQSVKWEAPEATRLSEHPYHIPSYSYQYYHPYNYSNIPPYMMPPDGSQPAPFHPGVEGPSPCRVKRKSTGKNISPKGRPSDDTAYANAIEHLNNSALEFPDLTIPNSDIGSTLVEESDCDLLTDYFFHIMKQLVVCRFTEKDRKTRGGKRENINIGYGGLQCRHCNQGNSSRKFFWSNVDRLANSFAEIPTHVLRCKQCPDVIKSALLLLKGRHPDQMQMLPRGSQKVFFRRMWRRLHHDNQRDSSPIKVETFFTSAESSDLIINPTDDTLKVPDVDSHAAARILAECLETESIKDETKFERILLAIPEDKEWLSDIDCFIRNNIEVFSSTNHDVEVAAADRKYPIKLGQVGIRCLHCAMTAEGARGAAVSYPYSISGIYESVREFQRMHFEKCVNRPPEVTGASMAASKGTTSLSSVLRRYYVQAARALGLVDAIDGGIRAGADPEPMSHAGFQSLPSAKQEVTVSIDSNSDAVQANILLEMSRKRKASPTQLIDEQERIDTKRHSEKESEFDDLAIYTKTAEV